jgi:hypothetical protein
MLHELLLALSGHPSPLFKDDIDTESSSFSPSTDHGAVLLSSSERALLKSIGTLSNSHRRLKSLLKTIADGHPSTICRSVAVAIHQTHLDRFQQRVLSVEGKILVKDASLVGAYNIVPLASVVGEFDDWHRLMAWYMRLAQFILPSSASKLQQSRDVFRGTCTGAALIDELRSEMQTGFPEIEVAATELCRVAELAWLRQTSAWVVYGRLPVSGAEDFFIQPEKVRHDVEANPETDSVSFVKIQALLPAHITSSTGSVMLFIGKSLHRVQAYRRTYPIISSKISDSQVDPAALAASHLAQLSSLTLPLVPTQFNRLILSLRSSLSKNVLQYLLPAHETTQLLGCLRQFFLLDRGEFAVALIEESEKRLRVRQHQLGRLVGQDRNPVQALKSLTMNDAELNQTLQAAWKDLAASNRGSINAIDYDDNLDYARQHISLVSTPRSIARPPSRPSSSDSTVLPQLSSVAFDDLLFPTPTALKFRITPPYDLILSSQDISVYSHIHSYLLAIRRGGRKLSGLWSMEGARRERRHKYDSFRVSDEHASILRSRRRTRAISMRKVWATCSAAVFLLSETSAHFEGEVRAGAGGRFRAWVEAGNQDEHGNVVVQHETNAGDQSTDQVSEDFQTHGMQGLLHTSVAQSQVSSSGWTASSILPVEESAATQQRRTDSRQSRIPKQENFTPHDPSSLSSTHRAHIYALAHALLLTDEPLTRALRDLLGAVDQLVAWFAEAIEGWRKSDDGYGMDEFGEEDDGMLQKEKERLLQLDRARKAVDSGLRAVVLRLRAIDEDRGGFGRLTSAFGDEEGDRSLEPASAGVHRLLMKLDFGRIANFSARDADPYTTHTGLFAHR